MTETKTEKLVEETANCLMKADGWSLKITQANINIKQHYLSRARVAIQAFKAAGGVFLSDNQELPQIIKLPFELDPSIPMVSLAGIGLEKSLYKAAKKTQQDMLNDNFRRVEEIQ